MAVIGLLVAAGISSANHRKSTPIQDISVIIDYDQGLSFVDEEEIRSSLELAHGAPITDEGMGSIKPQNLESALIKNPYIQNVEVFAGQDGILYVQITQKQPILRVINSEGVGYYLSNQGDKIPLSNKFTPKVLVATGNIENGPNGLHPGEETMLNNLLEMTAIINSDQFFESLIDQVHVKEDATLILVPKIGCREIHLGRFDDQIESRMEKLKLFYQEGLTNIGVNRYSKIDLRFEDQIVCTKK
jgi:cell division protein FtsQ